MSLASILLVLEEHDRQKACLVATDTNSRHLASAGKWGRRASSALTRFQREIRKRASHSPVRSVRFPAADLRAALGLPHS
ncbi:hypothetical protein OpiT1DRAFT_00212 [Opitutaceae bacterium TAV1]|nr:hypothetical protein OpiT1DRAFT_00212 [Opitutaceae bacterium TAV1]